MPFNPLLSPDSSKVTSPYTDIIAYYGKMTSPKSRYSMSGDAHIHVHIIRTDDTPGVILKSDKLKVWTPIATRTCSRVWDSVKPSDFIYFYYIAAPKIT
jgi:hypothetical protein